MVLHGAPTRGQAATIAFLPAEITTRIADLLSLRDAHALGRTAKAFSYLLAAVHCLDRAARARTLAQAHGALCEIPLTAPRALRANAIDRIANGPAAVALTACHTVSGLRRVLEDVKRASPEARMVAYEVLHHHIGAFPIAERALAFQALASAIQRSGLFSHPRLDRAAYDLCDSAVHLSIKAQGK
jgi:hypothetical protein